MTDNIEKKGEAVDDIYIIKLLILIRNQVSRIRIDCAINHIERTQLDVLTDLEYISPQHLEFMFPTFDGITIKAHISKLKEVFQ